jgi:Plasmid pRiA4b ORF-3-like protein
MDSPDQSDDLASVTGAQRQHDRRPALHAADRLRLERRAFDSVSHPWPGLYGVYHDGGTCFSTHPDQVRLGDFQFRINERFRYEYNFGDGWQHEVRVEARLALDDRRTYPCCIGGKRRAPPEDCGGPLAFMARRDAVPSRVEELLGDIEDDLEANDIEAIRDRGVDIEELRDWLTLDDFDRRGINRRLKQYAIHDEAGMRQSTGAGDESANPGSH